MDTKKYNGWSNYATWRVNLEIIDGLHWDNDTVFEDIASLKEYLQETVECLVFAEDEESMLAQYAKAFLDDVNYHEIAEAVIDSHSDVIKPEVSEVLETVDED